MLVVIINIMRKLACLVSVFIFSNLCLLDFVKKKSKNKKHDFIDF